MRLSNNKGYVALITSIFLGIVIVLLALGSALISSLNRKGSLDLSLKSRTDFLARACFEQALLKLAQNSNYSGNEDLTISGDTCHINPIQTSGSNKIIKTSSTILNSSTYLAITVNGATLQTVTFLEE